MTIFGKILVFINLLFSLVVGALVIFVYIARTNYAYEYDKLTKRYDVSQANAQQAHAARIKAEVDLENYVKKADGDVKTVEALLKARTDELDQLSRQYTEDRKKIAQYEAVQTGSQQEVARRQADVEKMRKPYAWKPRRTSPWSSRTTSTAPPRRPRSCKPPPCSIGTSSSKARCRKWLATSPAPSRRARSSPPRNGPQRQESAERKRRGTYQDRRFERAGEDLHRQRCGADS